jgi:hypothetical protein
MSFEYSNAYNKKTNTIPGIPKWDWPITGAKSHSNIREWTEYLPADVNKSLYNGLDDIMDMLSLYYNIRFKKLHSILLYLGLLIPNIQYPLNQRHYG